jgi:hypothetical protein
VPAEGDVNDGADQSARIWETLGGGHHAREIASAKGERPMSRPSIFLVVSLVASVGLLPTAAVANVPNNEAATYRLVTPIPNIGEAPNGDHAAIQVTQPFFFSVHPKSVSGGGTFTHTFTGGSFSTTWTATELLSFQPFGCGIAGDGTPRPPNFCGGRVEMAISIATPAGPVDGILTFFCEISDNGHFPAGFEEGVRLVIPGVINFNMSDGGANRFEKQP